jgi:hypothetical protein
MSRYGRTFLPWKPHKPPVIGPAVTPKLPPQPHLGIPTAVVVARKRAGWIPQWRDKTPPVDFPVPGGPPILRRITGASVAVLGAAQRRMRQPVLTRHRQPSILGPYVVPPVPVVDTSLPPAVATLASGSRSRDAVNQAALILSRGDTRHTLKGADNRLTIEGY